jgi:arginase
MTKHLNLFFPQWQGSAPDLAPYYGAQELKQLYLGGIDFAGAGVSADPAGGLKHNIIAYDDIVKQLADVNALLEAKKPDTLFTVGAACDADITSIAYLNRHPLNQHSSGKFAVLWFDAHGDINSPESSATKLFYGMPIRFLLENHDKAINGILNTQMEPGQFFLLGVRALDEPEKEYIRNQNITCLDVQRIEQNIKIIQQELKAKGYGRIYIHVDLDVLDPKQFPHIAVPVGRGMRVETLYNILEGLAEEFTVIGLGLFEYTPSKRADIDLLKMIIKTGARLSL